MKWVRNKDNGNIYGPLGENSPEYAYLAGHIPSGVTVSSSPRSVVDGRPLFEEISDAQANALNSNMPFARFSLAKYFGAVTTAADDVNTALGTSPSDGTLVGAVVVVATTFTGQATNFRTISVFNDGTPANPGASYAQVNAVNMATLALSSTGVSLTAGQENALSINNAAVNCNDILRFGNIHSGTGQVMGDGLLLLTFSRKV